MDRDTLIRMQNVGLYYKRSHIFYSSRRGQFWALRDVSLSIKKGETFGIIGRNGAGKSTLLKIMAGILKPDRGIYERQPKCRVALLSLQVGFVPHLTGRENVMLSGLLLGYNRAEIKERFPDIVAFSELGDFIEQPIYTYSTGMKARLGFAVAFYTNPDVLLVDEILGVGDAEFKKKSTAKMKERLQSNMTVVLVSHNASSIRQLCNRAAWIEGGKTQLEADTATVLQAYDDALNLKNGK